MSDTEKISLDIAEDTPVTGVEETKSNPDATTTPESKPDPVLAEEDPEGAGSGTGSADAADESDDELDADVAAILDEAAPKMESYSGSLDELVSKVPTDLNIYRVDGDHLTMVPEGYTGQVITLVTGDGVSIHVTREVAELGQTWKNGLETSADHGSGDIHSIPLASSFANSIMMLTTYMYWMTTNTPTPIKRPLEHSDIDKVFDNDWERSFAKYLFESTKSTVSSGGSNKDTLLFRSTLDAQSCSCEHLLNVLCMINALIIKSGDKEFVTKFYKGTPLSPDQEADAEKNKWVGTTKE